MLAEKAEYLSAGVHIGMKSCTKYMKNFVYKIRDDGLAVFNLQKVDNRIKTAADFISRFNKVLIVTHKMNSGSILKKFSEITGIDVTVGRFSPGTLTNPSYKGFCEPDLIMVADPQLDKQVITEAMKKRIPVIALCDTFNDAGNVDLVVPINNNGKKAIGLVFLILAREILKNKGKLKKNSDFKFKLKDFGIEERKPKEEVVE